MRATHRNPRYDDSACRTCSSRPVEPTAKRTWTPGFFERLLRMAPEINLEVPERLPPNPYRERILDELAED